MACQVMGDEVHKEYEDLVRPHVESFDFFIGEGMQRMVEDMEPVELTNPVTKATWRYWFDSPRVGKPTKEDAAPGSDTRLFPRDCREAGITYKAPFEIDFCYAVEGQEPLRITRRLGAMPIMVKSKQCYLRHLNRPEMVKAREEANEVGGYFICNGIERIIRMLIAQRRHYIMGLKRGAYRKRGANYTDYATLIRCVRPDQSSATVRCHYLTDGAVNFAFTMRRAEYFIPAGLLLKCFLEVSDKELYDKIVAGAPGGSGHEAFVAERAELLLHAAAKHGCRTRAEALEYLGRHFRVVLDLPPATSDFQAGLQLLRDYVFIHLTNPADKLGLLVSMLHKLYALANSQCCDDNADALTHHEIMLPGHLLLKFANEKLADCMAMFKELVKKDLESTPETVQLGDAKYLQKHVDKMPDIGKKFEYLLNTGNLVSKSGLDLSQATGFTVVAERLNFFRYLSHFRSVHRGAYFATLRTTTVRKLMPESWGFMCPVHTPDGSPCGLLNHFTANCRVVTRGPEENVDVEEALTKVLVQLGMVPSSPAVTPPPLPDYLPVTLDGRVAGHVRAGQAAAIVARLREIKVAALDGEEGRDGDERPVLELVGPEADIPSDLEVAHIPFALGGPYPGLFLFTQASRMMRPVTHLGTGSPELIGTLEQNNMHIRCPDSGAGGSPGLAFSHAELNAMAMLSVVASMTPYSDYNQSPRNMYQCQMGKQTMGTPTQVWGHRSDGKLYRLHTPQTPMARTARYEQYCMDEYPNGTNAVVAVLAYTGFDMEDAMILNKSSVDRGMFHASVFKTECIDLRDEKKAKMAFAPEPAPPHLAGKVPPRPEGAFGQKYPQNIVSLPGSEAIGKLGVKPMGAHRNAEALDGDGLPHVGAAIWPGHSYYSSKDTVTGRFKPHKLKGEEVAHIDQVAIIGSKQKGLQRANIKMRLTRYPAIGDKFASRAGQKGVLSIRWPDVDMPWCASTGVRPDLIINPHAFPSRMTIGMLLESMGSKAGALHGKYVDCSPFQRADGKMANPAEEFGRQLEAAGFAKHGQETMVSGITGEEMPCDIYVGLVYYQRLRHMVSDKFQVRSTGPINNLTKQPVKGRKLGGGIRFGEMERDSLLAHGAAYLLHDRLHACSDYHVLDVCTGCGSVLAPYNKPPGVVGMRADMTLSADGVRGGTIGKVVCPLCDGSGKHVERVAVPYVFKYLATELTSMGIKLEMGLK